VAKPRSRKSRPDEKELKPDVILMTCPFPDQKVYGWRKF
jgi:hypothetical protein